MKTYECVNCNLLIEKESNERYIDCPTCPEYEMKWVEGK